MRASSVGRRSSNPPSKFLPACRFKMHGTHASPQPSPYAHRHWLNIISLVTRPSWPSITWMTGTCAKTRGSTGGQDGALAGPGAQCGRMPCCYDPHYPPQQLPGAPIALPAAAPGTPAQWRA